MHTLDRLGQKLDNARRDIKLVRIGGTVTEVTPAFISVAGLSSFIKLGDCIKFGEDGSSALGEVVRIDQQNATIKIFDHASSIGLGDKAWRMGPFQICPDPSWKGRVINALGIPIDGGDALRLGEESQSIHAAPPPAMRRARVTKPMRTGVRVIDLFTPLCAGQRIGIFAGSGVGKSTLLGMLAGSREFDTVVIGLVGERGREVREFLDEVLADHLANAVTIVATGDESSLMRRLAPNTAMTIAEFFRDRGENVLLIVDSVTRFAHAARDVALAAGEMAVARGYAPSVFTDLPKLLERAGPGLDGSGSITGIFSVLVDGDDHNEPIADTIRGTLDGHIVLDRAIADQGRFPAVNILRSISRLAQHVWTPEQQGLVLKIRGLIARYEDTRDLRLMGGYQPGSDGELDQAIALVPKIYQAMEQTPKSPASQDAFRELAEILQDKG
ncbi:flagellar protein export ATPase FliI [Beijerinckia indica]|uniref:Flagellum-specific ATP synthase n=1 Tax=Beijerinckia indica subsp. indica (strain ATCC 9039 / DSM 1715 / NCIMB 8712) TaxID=395963 RepID=B2IK05_BEII9|nr:ATPase, FliI/YscN family [Beijerinckia indica subsp. indica ATCC 9039]